jgi:hypothetical protein
MIKLKEGLQRRLNTLPRNAYDEAISLARDIVEEHGGIPGTVALRLFLLQDDGAQINRVLHGLPVFEDGAR